MRAWAFAVGPRVIFKKNINNTRPARESPSCSNNSSAASAAAHIIIDCSMSMLASMLASMLVPMLLSVPPDSAATKRTDAPQAPPATMTMTVDPDVPRAPMNNSDLGASNPAYSHTYRTFTNKSAGAVACQAECDSDRRCTSWTYVVGGMPNGRERCCRFAARGCPRHLVGAISGAKVRGPCQLPPQPPPPTPPPGVNLSWVFKDNAALRYCHQGFVELVHRVGAEPRLVTAWQAGSTAAEGAGPQWIFKAESGVPASSPLVWSPAAAGPHHAAAGDGVHPAWSPTLFEDPQEVGRVWLIYNEGAARNGSVQHTGGSVYAKLSTDGARTFGSPRVILGYDAWGGVDKVTIDQVRVTPDGKQWLLAFNSQCVGMTASAQHSPRNSGSPLCATGVLMTDSRGETWTMLEGIITDVANITDFQEATLELCSPTRWLMLFRTKTGFIYRSTSTNSGRSWGASVPTELLNPASRVNLLARRGGNSGVRELLLAYNPSKTRRQPLDLARSNTCGETWEHVKTLYAGHGSYPTMLQVNDDLVTTFTRDGKGVGIGAAVTRLPPPMSVSRLVSLKSDETTIFRAKMNPSRRPPSTAAHGDVPALLRVSFANAAAPILPPNRSSAFDSAVCMNPNIVKAGNQWRLFYAGADAKYTHRIALATAPVEGPTPMHAKWTRHGVVVDVGAPGSFNSIWSVLPLVHRFGDTWHLYFTGRSTACPYTNQSGLQTFWGIASRRRECHSAAPPSTLYRVRDPGFLVEY